MGFGFKQLFEGLRIKAKAALTSDTKGELEVDSSSGKLNYHNGTTRSPVVTESHTATLTNKTLTSPVINTPTGITKSDVGLGNVDNTSDATKDAAVATLTNKTLTSPVINSPTGIVKGDVGLGNVDNTSDATKNSASATLTNKTIDAASNTISNITNTEISASAAIARTKIASGTANKVLVNDGSGVLAEMSGVLNSTNAITLDNTKHLELQAATDATTTGSNASLAAFNGACIRLTNVSLTSLANIPAGQNGQEVVIINRTGVSISIKDSSGAIGTAANRILTGSAADITLAADAALLLSYDSATSRWQVIGGSGSGAAASAIDNIFTINDATDATKQINFDAGGTTSTKTTIAAAQTANRVITLPDLTDTLVSKTSTDTLTNKTLTSPVINTPTGITKSDVGLGNVDNTSNATERAATATLTNKTIVAANNTITTAASGNLSATSLNSALAELQSDIDSRVKLPNYIVNADAEVDTTGWATYADAAATSPVDGTGGSPTLTFTRTTSSPLRGAASFLITKDAANRQGNGASYDFTIDASDKGKVLQCSFEYQIASGTFADNDLSVWIYDVTNASLIQPAPYLIKNSGIIEKFAVEFQTASNSTSYRLIVHVGSTSASAYTVKLDNVVLGPQAKLYGSAITDWVSYTPTGTWVTNTTYQGKYRRVGDSLEIEARVALTGAPTGSFTMNLPSGFSIDITKIPSGSVDNTESMGIASLNVAGVRYVGGVGLSSSTAIMINTHGGGGPVNATIPGTFASGSIIQMQIQVPITGWSSSQVFSQDASSRVVSAHYQQPSAQSIAASTFVVVDFATKIIDDAAAVTTGASWKYTIQTPGKYKIYAQIAWANASFTTGNGTYLFIRKNGSQRVSHSDVQQSTSTRSKTQSVSIIIDCAAGDYIDAQVYQQESTARTLLADATYNYITIERLTGPAQIAASESVSALYTGAPPTGTLNASLNTVTFGTKVKDSHNAMSSGSYTIPVSGVYSISAEVGINGTRVLGSTDQMNILADATTIASNIQTAYGSLTGTAFPSISIQGYPLLAGQVITVKTTSSASSLSYDSVASRAYFSIVRTGNY